VEVPLPAQASPASRPITGPPGPFLPPWTPGTTAASPGAPLPDAPPCAALRRVGEAEPKRRSRHLRFPSSIGRPVDSHPFAFLASLALASLLAEVKQTLTNFPTAHHNLGSSRTMPRRLGGFSFKSNKCHKDYFTKLKCSQRGSHSTLAWIFHKSTKPY
jgi:hypothetical protein